MFFLKKIIVAAPEVPTISTVKRYFNVSPYLIIEQEGHGKTHFISMVQVRMWLWSMVFFVILQEAAGMQSSLKFWKMDGLQAKFSLWGLGYLAAWVNQHPYWNRYHGKSFANFLLVSIFSLCLLSSGVLCKEDNDKSVGDLFQFVPNPFMEKPTNLGLSLGIPYSFYSSHQCWFI